jgi:phosphoribosylformimino-5-aminoimidazole carboxamide ribonucleotide (ProFAR) isomerase
VDIYPAIDIEGGRLARAPVKPAGGASDPVARAEAFRAEGAAWIHVVDLDRAFGRGDNGALVRRVCAVSGVAVQVGGNVDDSGWARELVDAGAARVVFGLAAALDPELLGRLVAAVGAPRAAVAIDVRDGVPTLRASGPVSFPLADIAERVRQAGVETVVHRDLDRDGALSGADVGAAAALAGSGLRVIAAGGVASLRELERAATSALSGMIVGRALLEGVFTLREAIACSA